MASNGNISPFRYFPFLGELASTGQFTWETPEQHGREKLITRLYIDGDIINFYPQDEEGFLPEFSPELINEHTTKINRDLASVNVMAGHLGMAAAFLTAILSWAINPANWPEQTIIVSAIALVGYLAKKITIPVIFKIIGGVVNVFAGKRK